MSENRWHVAAKALMDRDYGDEVKADHLALVNERLDAEGLRGKVWGAMTYVCERCGYAEYREMEVGVEGPPHWRDDLTFIPTAFTAGRCHACGGVMTHKHFASDVEYDGPEEPTAKAVFRVPREWPLYPTQGCDADGNVVIARGDSAFLSIPQHDLYLVLSEEERAKGFVRPYADHYEHARELGGCGAVTRMGVVLSETYARDPNFYGATYCVGCQMHKKIGGADGEFFWLDDRGQKRLEREGEPWKVGT